MTDQPRSADAEARAIIADHAPVDGGFRCQCDWEVPAHISIVHGRHTWHLLSKLDEAGLIVMKVPEPEIGLHGRHEVSGTGIQIQFTDTEFIMWIPNRVDGTTLRKVFDREAGKVLISALLAAEVGK